MTGIDTIVDEPVVQAVGWALLHFVWQGTLIAVIAAAGLRALRHSAADVRYVVAAIALSLMATLPVVTGVQTWRQLTAERPGDAGAATPDLAPAAVEPRASAPLASATVSLSPAPAPVAVGAIARWIPWFVVGWMAGVLLLAVRLAGGWIAIQRLTSREAVPADAGLQALVRRLTRSLHISRRVRLLLSSSVEVPTVIGWLKPTVLLPMSALSGLSPLQVEAILAHELAHIRRHDYLVNLLQTLLETLLFYHPAVWWLSGRIRAEREHCCDDLAVSLCGDPVVYARALADMEELRASEGRLVLAASGGPLLQRVRRLLATPATHAGRGPAWMAAGAAVVLMLGIVVSAGGGAGATAGEEPAAVPHATVKTMEAAPWDSIRLQVARTLHLLLNITGLAQDPPAPPPAPPMPPAPPAPPAPAPMAPGGGYADVPPPALPPSPTIPDFPSVPGLAPPAPSAAVPGVPPPPGAAPLPPVPSAGRVPGLAPAPPAMPAPPSLPAPPAGTTIVDGTRQESSGNFTWSSNGEKIEVKYRGSFELTEDDTDVAKMSPGGYLRISDGRWLRGSSVEFQADGSGTITRRFFIGSSERPFEPEGRAWLKQNFPRFVRMSGFDAKGRTARIYKKGGADAVLKEIALIQGSHAKKTYYTELLALIPSDAAVARRILSQAAAEIDSDYEMATLLIAGADKLLLDDATRRLYFDAARTISSDYEMKRVYVSALKRGPVSPALLAGVLDAARSIESDYEAATLLVDVAKSHDVNAEVRRPFFALLDTVESSYEKARVLQTLLRRGQLPGDAVSDVLRATSTIGSNYEAGQVLQLAARTQSITGPAREDYLKIADRLGDHEQNQALAALVRSERR